jgi:hypothetical protein
LAAAGAGALVAAQIRFIVVGGVAGAAHGSVTEPCLVGETEFRVLSLPALVAAKRAAGRPKDREHLIELEALARLKQQK